MVPGSSWKSTAGIVLNAIARGPSASTLTCIPGREVGTLAVPGSFALNSTRIASTGVVPTLAGAWVVAGV